MTVGFLNSAKKEFLYYKVLGETAIAAVPEEKLFWQYNDESNSIAIIIRHLSGNMLSRWTDFLTTDGEKEWRDRDLEFDHRVQTKEDLMKAWDEGWKCLFDAIESLSTEDLVKEIFIRHKSHTVVEAINRQLAHYPYHIGQIIFLAKLMNGKS